MKLKLNWILMMGLLWASMALAAERELEVVVVRGADGAAEYGKRFDEQVRAWQEACAKAAVRCDVIGADPKAAADAEALKQRLAKSAAPESKSLWLVFIGHGTFDGREDKFNFRGADAGSKEIAVWLKPLKQEVVVIQCASASGGWVKALTGGNRVIVTATKGPDEVFYSHFGEYFAKAIGGHSEADLDADAQVSLLEAFLYSSHQVVDFYEKEGRIATEHAVLEDNGDAAATRSEVFHGVEATLAPDGSKPDGDRARQLALVLSDTEQKLTPDVRVKRDALETQLRALKKKRGEMTEDVFFAEAEKILRELGAIYAPAKTN